MDKTLGVALFAIMMLEPTATAAQERPADLLVEVLGQDTVFDLTPLRDPKDSDQYNFAKWRDAQARDSWARARERGNVVSVTVLTALRSDSSRVEWTR